MLLLYVCAQLGKIQASAKKVLVPKIKSLVQEGECYAIENVLVTHNEPKYRCTGHVFRLNLIDRTKFIKIENSAIPSHHFDFVPFKDILESTKEETYLGILVLTYSPCLQYNGAYHNITICLIYLFFTDVIGHVVERDVLKEKDDNGKKSKLIGITALFYDPF